MQLWLCLALVAFLPGIICPPVKPGKQEAPKEPEKDIEDTDGDNDDPPLGLEYERYLREVVSVLESDEDFRKKLEASNATDIKSGQIAEHLDFVAHDIRTKLDEIKRNEIERLKAIVRVKAKTPGGLRDFDLQRLTAHVDHANPASFEPKDLARLIKQATTDLENIDKQRRDEFKRYEMQKELELKKKIEEIKDPEERRKMQEMHDKMKQKHQEHAKLNHPGSKKQLEEVWEDSDHLDKDDFNPATFFALHDTDGNGFLDFAEVEALFTKELDKLYDPNAPEDDMKERIEEMNRMREHVFAEIDKDKDGMISRQEFMDSTQKQDFENDEGWKTIDEEKQYTEDEYKQFQAEWEKQQQDGHAQVGEINIPADHLGQPQAQEVNRMNQDPNAVQQEAELHQQKVPPGGDHAKKPPPPPQGLYDKHEAARQVLQQQHEQEAQERLQQFPGAGQQQQQRNQQQQQEQQQQQQENQQQQQEQQEQMMREQQAFQQKQEAFEQHQALLRQQAAQQDPAVAQP